MLSGLKSRSPFSLGILMLLALMAWSLSTPSNSLSTVPTLHAQEESTPRTERELTPSEPAKAAPKKGPQGFFQILFSGGPIGVIIMLVLIGLSITSLYLMIENALIIRRRDLLPEGLGEDVRESILAQNLPEAIATCREQPSLLSFVLQCGLTEAECGWSDVEKAMEDALAEQAARLLRKVEYLSVLGNIAPMVGLLGTVTGMLMAFKEVADSEGSAGASQLAEGIYQALVTTVVGLIIAIPSLGAFAVLRNRVDQIIAEAAYAAQHALAPIKRNAQRLLASPPPPPPVAGGR